ncbi:predicted protein [Plenodomus lingam JN3]|uniref:Predicted protein n=1 Tax=Leptosphaeria maculans (strain JN3 / isolate v23.1.3 / race Av1-4-5-6-7-8) TaxID=985895 RepID=E4ZWK3_LEPMJ|nr:predicted protein [Plenodomus lingam JN3]CBX95979.1 predicted protein [Plenodomus lingam JN3]
MEFSGVGFCIGGEKDASSSLIGHCYNLLVREDGAHAGSGCGRIQYTQILYRLANGIKVLQYGSCRYQSLLRSSTPNQSINHYNQYSHSPSIFTVPYNHTSSPFQPTLILNPAPLTRRDDWEANCDITSYLG